MRENFASDLNRSDPVFSHYLEVPVAHETPTLAIKTTVSLNTFHTYHLVKHSYDTELNKGILDGSCKSDWDELNQV